MKKKVEKLTKKEKEIEQRIKWNAICSTARILELRELRKPKAVTEVIYKS